MYICIVSLLKNTLWIVWISILLVHLIDWFPTFNILKTTMTQIIFSKQFMLVLLDANKSVKKCFWGDTKTRLCLSIFTFLLKGTFYSESAGEMWNRHIKVLKIVLWLLFPVSNMNCCYKMLVFTFFCVNKINLFKARTKKY